MKVKSKFYKTVAKSTVVNGTECKALNKIYKNKIEVTKMKILKWMYVVEWMFIYVSIYYIMCMRACARIGSRSNRKEKEWSGLDILREKKKWNSKESKSQV